MKSKEFISIWLDLFLLKSPVTNENHNAHINMTQYKDLCDFHMEIDNIDRHKMMKLWRNK